MNRRDTVFALVALGASPLAAKAQQPGKVWRLGHLTLSSGPDEMVEAFRAQLRALGYIEGGNLSIEYRWAAGNLERLPEMAAELVRLNVDVIVTRTAIVALAAKGATSTIPIVMANAADPVGMGVIASLARPGGNVTGLTQNSMETAGKRLQLLRELVPKVTRVAALIWEPGHDKVFFLEEIRVAARKLGVTLVLHEVGTPEALTSAFGAMRRERAQALIVQTTPFAGNNRKLIVELAAQHRLPTISESRAFVDEGGLISYGPSLVEMWRRAATYVDKILKGARPADLPVEQPNTYELVVSLKAAKALGLTIPQSVLARADEVIR
jgi:putative ABC transport system substrate-binding protein